MFGMKNRKIRNYIVNPRFQLWFIARMLVLAVAVVVLVFGANSYFFLVFEQKGRDLGLAPDHVFFKFIHAQKQEMMTIFAMTAVIVVTMIVWHGVRFSHRIAGPLYRLNMDMRQMAKDGKVRNIRFRKGDYFLELPEAFNSLLEKIGQKPGGPANKS